MSSSSPSLEKWIIDSKYVKSQSKGVTISSWELLDRDKTRPDLLPRTCPLEGRTTDRPGLYELFSRKERKSKESSHLWTGKRKGKSVSVGEAR